MQFYEFTHFRTELSLYLRLEKDKALQKIQVMDLKIAPSINWKKTNEKKIAEPTRSFLWLKISWKSVEDMTTLSCAIANARVKERTKNYDIILSPNCRKWPLGQRRKSELQNSILFLRDTQQHCTQRFPNSLKAGNSSESDIKK